AYTGAVTGGFVRGLDNAAAELIASSVIAGSISEATGGKFANGAAYGAFSWAVAQGANSLKEGGLSDGENRDGQNYSAEAAKALDDLNDRIADLKNFNSKDEALKWLHENAHPLAVNYDIEIGANIFEDFGNWRIGNTVSDFEAHYIYGRTIMQSKAPAKGWNWRANWHSHAKGVSTDFSGQDSNLYLNLNRGRSPKLTFHVSVFNGEKNVLLDY
ncbi:hypothetical protein, partial [Marinimicrobium sp. ARAG 43.8]|uniref:hypothetical protein n=1 Tax=Marinimicrobium sp. ARAG 43.8 TaxID=3418719 RepID=UPI003CF881DF